MPELSDQQLVAGALAGDNSFLDILVGRHLKPLCNFLLRFVGDKEQAEDLAQETFIKMWRSLKRFDPKKKFRTWLYQIAKNCAIDYTRKKKPILAASLLNDDEKTDLSEMAIDQQISSLEQIEASEVAEEARALVAQLSPAYQIVLELYYFEEFNFREISEILQESVHTVKSRHLRALKRLRELVGNGEQKPSPSAPK